MGLKDVTTIALLQQFFKSVFNIIDLNKELKTSFSFEDKKITFTKKFKGIAATMTSPTFVLKEYLVDIMSISLEMQFTKKNIKTSFTVDVMGEDGTQNIYSYGGNKIECTESGFNLYKNGRKSVYVSFEVKNKGINNFLIGLCNSIQELRY